MTVIQNQNQKQCQKTQNQTDSLCNPEPAFFLIYIDIRIIFSILILDNPVSHILLKSIRLNSGYLVCGFQIVLLLHVVVLCDALIHSITAAWGHCPACIQKHIFVIPYVKISVVLIGNPISECIGIRRFYVIFLDVFF